MTEKDQPVGIIDSGIGGFSVALCMQRKLPHEDLLYFGDGGNMPYGNHSAGEILEMTRYMLRFMEERKVKVLLVACNTISTLIDQYRGDMSCPVLSVVEAGAEAAASMSAKKVGVISTCFTDSTRCYPSSIEKLAPEKVVFSHGCPDLARLVETYVGDPAGGEILDKDIQANLDDLVHRDRIDCCVLGCTHYPLVAENIHRLYPELPLIDPAEHMVQTVGAYLQEKGIQNDQKAQGTLEIYTTASVAEYQEKAERVGLSPITAVREYPIMKQKN